MSKWMAWEKIAKGPFKGTPQLGSAGLGASGYITTVRDRAGNMSKYYPAQHDLPGQIVKIGGASELAHMPDGHWYMGGFLATGKDGSIYYLDYENEPSWKKMGGPGRFLGEVYSWSTMDGYAEVLGEGTDHQLAYNFSSRQQRQHNTITDWDNLGQPGEPGGKKGLNGRPCVVNTAEEMHIFVRGQDNHLWHISGKDNMPHKRTFGRWTNLGGGLTAPPVAVSYKDKIELFVLGDKQELFVNTWDGKKWSGFQSLGGQLQGLPSPIYLWGSDTTFVFGRGVQNKLWYRRRNGKTWQRWQSVGDNLQSDVAVWEDCYGTDGGNVYCVALRNNGDLWARQLKLTTDEHKGENSTLASAKVAYTVQSGDWLYRIARAVSVDVTRLKNSNKHIRDFDKLKAGDQLSIPIKLIDGKVIYIVQEGDTLSRIAAAFGTTTAKVMSANSLRQANVIGVGTSLKLPAGS